MSAGNPDQKVYVYAVFSSLTNLEKFQDRPLGLKFSSEIETNGISSEIENFKRATHQTPIFVGEFSRSRFKISSEPEVFKRD